MALPRSSWRLCVVTADAGCPSSGAVSRRTAFPLAVQELSIYRRSGSRAHLGTSPPPGCCAGRWRGSSSSRRSRVGLHIGFAGAQLLRDSDGGNLGRRRTTLHRGPIRRRGRSSSDDRTLHRDRMRGYAGSSCLPLALWVVSPFSCCSTPSRRSCRVRVRLGRNGFEWARDHRPIRCQGQRRPCRQPLCHSRRGGPRLHLEQPVSISGPPGIAAGAR